MLPRRDSLSYAFVRTVIRMVLLLLTRTSVRGSQRLPRQGAGIIVCNHLAAVDPGVLVAVLPRPIALMSKVENNRGPLKLFMPMVGAFTVRRGAADRSALRMAERVLAEQRLLCLFPEGTRSRSGELGAGHGGAALLAVKTGAPIIPIAITGTPAIFRPRFPWLGIPRVTVTIGEPFVLSTATGVPQRAERERLTAEIMARIAALLPPEQRGGYQVAPSA